MQKTLKERFVELQKENFSEASFLDFFGSLNENEIKLILANLPKENQSFKAEHINFIETYLKKLLEKIEEIKK